MFPQQSHGEPIRRSFLGSSILLALIVSSITINQSAEAHKVKTTEDVGATIHIEPNDNPRAGEASKAWFALTRKGGKVIPLSECKCQLAIYAEPHAVKEPALLEPALQPMTVERYKGIPGAEVTFPRPGVYQLQLRGKPASGESFKPFELKFEVTVAAGSATAAKTKQDAANLNSAGVENQNQTSPIWAIAFPALGVMGIIFFLMQRMKKSGE
ncbi:MAG: hypothetical protein KME60_32500 [Cyanomargarita calcarea GSE-NOS-MK-12-04C]|jgi:hypothetical protein|uniref:Uncharacterized protein n=1 Tax=Cyanomargarita calcarea GSE-NOS-MK-12-04C TaxID=2839659 RepID=A0A951QU14_9CYAN|nr:hypothetical protein [Cyanomargarita calcarea GSE-NOS-MK-12-04C]